MVYYLDVLFAIYILASGFSVSWIVSETARLSGWRAPAYAGDGFERFSLANVLLTIFAGPRLLIGNGLREWRHGEISSGTVALVVAVTLGWSALLGVVVLQLAFFSGFFLG